jgi:glycosidase
MATRLKNVTNKAMPSNISPRYHKKDLPENRLTYLRLPFNHCGKVISCFQKYKIDTSKLTQNYVCHRYREPSPEEKNSVPGGSGNQRNQDNLFGKSTEGFVLASKTVESPDFHASQPKLS